jgi:hypothetical protein
MQSANEVDKSHMEGAARIILTVDAPYPLANACNIHDGELKMIVLLSCPMMNIPRHGLPSLGHFVVLMSPQLP